MSNAYVGNNSGGSGGSAITTIDVDNGGSVTGSTIKLYAKPGDGSANAGATVAFNAVSATEIDLKISDTTKFNTLVGYSTGNTTLTSGSVENTGVGYECLSSLTSGPGNTAFGYKCLNALTSARTNIAIGDCLQLVTTGSSNVVVGSDSAFPILTGSFNTGLGWNAGINYTGAESNNIAIANTGVLGESNVLRLGTQGNGNRQINTSYIAGISGASFKATPSVGAVVIDTNTGQLVSASSGVSTSGYVLTSTGVSSAPTWQAVPTGTITINGDSGSIIGTNVTIYADQTALNCGSSVSFTNSGTISTLNVTDSNNNILIGKSCGSSTVTGTNNTSIGYSCFSASSNGSAYAIAIGYEAMMGATADIGSVAIGSTSLRALTGGSYNTAVGANCGANLLTGIYNHLVGAYAGINYIGAESSNLMIANGGVVGESNVIRIGTQGSGSGQQNLFYAAGIASASFQAGSPTPKTVIIDTSTGQLIAGGAASNNWVDQTTTPVTMTTNTGYTSDAGATLVVFTLPTTSAVGDFVEINGKGSGLWTIHQAAGQQIFISPNSTTSGTGGSLSSVNQHDNVCLRCITANTVWTVVSQQSTGLTVV